jgi:hypothetical protein
MMARAAALFVIAGLVPAIQRVFRGLRRHVDARVEPGRDEYQ